MKKLAVYCPFDQSHIADVEMQTADDVERMLSTAKALFNDRDAWLPPHQRIAILNKLIPLMEAQKEELAYLIASEGGKPLIDARVEVARAIDGVGVAIHELSHLKGTEIPMGLTPAAEGKVAFTTREPIGVVLAISAFNHPLNLIIHQAIAAVAAGCPVIVKPASSTPLNCLKVVALLQKAGLPEGWCQSCVCDNETVGLLVKDPRIAFLSFIGSGKVGWMLRQQVAPGVRCALEHGGVAPVIIDESADIDALLPKLVKGGFYHAGQVCVSVQRVFAPEAMAESLAKKLAQAAEKLIVGDARDEKTEVGPLIVPAEVDRVHKWVTEAIEQGAQCFCGGKKLSETTYAPTVLLNPPDDATISTLEVFGPVVCVYSYTDRLAAIAQANSLPYAFQAAVFSQHIDSAMDTVKRLDATAVMVNDHTAFRVDWMPFGGRRQSGLSLGGIGYTMHDMTQEKMIVLQI